MQLHKLAGLVALALVLAVGCSATMDADDAATMDGSAGHDAAADGGPTAACTTNADCDDGLFCNGAETCAADGCRAGTAPCTASQTCDEGADRCVTGCGTTEDADGDSHRSDDCGGDDCDDADPNRFPGNTEVCDTSGHDEDCDPSTYGFRDADGDGEPDARCCNGTTCGTDCDDMRPSVHPSAVETCNAIDDDCDTAIDEGVQNTYYVDADGDGFGDASASTVMACFVPAGYSSDSTDCDDGNRDINPAHGEVCDAAMVDENCDGVVNPPALCNCTGTDSRPCAAPGACASGTEMCNMGMYGTCSIMPVAETCNGVDDDCNGIVDDGMRVNCFPDGDNDGYAPAGAVMTSECYVPTRPLVGGCPVGHTDLAPTGANIDCDDVLQRVSPAATETCNGVDDNCNGTVDEGLTVVCYADMDNDTYPPTGAMMFDSCPVASRASVGGCPTMETNRLPMLGAIDCADNNPLRSPGTSELCNSIDDNCNGMIDEGVGTSCYTDADHDTFAPMGAMAVLMCGGCTMGFTSRAPTPGATDCNDSVGTIFPGAMDICDSMNVDDDCNGTPNDPPGGCACSVGPPPQTQSCCVGRGTQTCSSGQWAPCTVTAQPEVCNNVDDDCDGAVDNGVRATCYTDADNDGYAPMGAATTQACLPCATGTTSRAPTAGNIDCNDGNANVNPSAADPCDGVDNNCDGVTDPGFCRIAGTCYANGVDNPANPSCQYCSTTTPSVWTNRPTGTACDDANAATCTTCNASGACAPVSGGNCGDLYSCTTDYCVAGPPLSCTHTYTGCVIAGVCVGSGALNPANPCQSCQPSVNPTAYTNRADNSNCGCGGGTADICCNGACVDAGGAGHCGSCAVTSCTRGCYQGPNGGTCGNACTASTFRCCAGPVGTICECL